MKKLLIFMMISFLAGMTVLCFCFPKQEISESERRKLKQFPEVSLETIISGKFMDEFEEYAADQFPFREIWRALKSKITLNVFGQLDNNELYISDGYAVKMEYPLQEESIRRAAKIFDNIYETQLKEKDCSIYYSIIPDKNCFLGEEHLRLDYERLETIMQEELDEMTYIDITTLLGAEDYYRTDAHWKQECIVDVAEKIGSAMEAKVQTEYQLEKIDAPFYGVYYGQSALPMEPDELCYLTNAALESCTVFDYQNNKETKIYDMEKMDGQDLYEIFLSGSISLLEITNPQSQTDKELVVFRDSFGSAIAPLLVQGYEKITLIDIRYIPSKLIEKYIDFHGQDVLFLYSTSVLNHSETLK